MRNEYENRGDVTAIFLPSAHRGDDLIRETLIDTSDFEIVDTFPNRWFAVGSDWGEFWYARGRIQRGSKQETFRIHRLVMAAPRDMYVDHINHLTLDNRRCNLRIVDNSENSLNRRGPNRTSKSGVRGVYWKPSMGKWCASVNVRRQSGKSWHIGYFSDLEDARAAVERALAELNVPGHELTAAGDVPHARLGQSPRYLRSKLLAWLTEQAAA